MSARTFILIVALAGIAPILRGDVIYLKNGKQIECIRAWEEGKEIRYKVADGTVGIPRGMVAKIVKSDPPKPDPVENEAPKPPVQTEKKNTIEAKKLLESIQELEKKDTSDKKIKEQLGLLCTQNGEALLEKNDFAGALEYFEKAHKYVKNERTTLNLALVYFLLKDDWNAQMYFREILKINPKSTIALNYLAEMHWRKEELDAAEELWKKSLAVKSDPLVEEKLKRLQKERTASAGYDNTASRHFLIKYDEGVADSFLVQEISDALEEAYKLLSMQFESYPSEPFVVVLYPRKDYFNVVDVPAWSAGANDGKIKLPIRGITNVTEELRGVLIHELSHSFVDGKTLGNNPTWLQEGLAQYSEGKRTSTEAREILKNLIGRGVLPRIEQLSGSFSGANAKTAAVLYVQSLSFVEYLVEQNQFYQMNEFLEHLGNQESTTNAFEAAYLMSMDDMETSWRRFLMD